jgi:hypothetical protein
MVASTSGGIDDSAMNAITAPVIRPTAGSSSQVLTNDRPSWRTSSNDQAPSRATSGTSSPLSHPTNAASTQSNVSARTESARTVVNEPAPSTTTSLPLTPFRPNLAEAVVTKGVDPTLVESENKILWAAHKCYQIWEGLDNEGKLKFLHDRTLPVPDTPEPPLLCRAMIKSIPDHLRPLFRMILQGLNEIGMSSTTAVEGLNKYLVSVLE